ncbi:DUF1118-domain-containing protein [Coccomyxa subellipsoidea C-169]|uniref:DUF1118-domain-containing protein n=1 Tax=Coccomyxa subellipsoidea (strain C-169) TaxID=574566 RepID=I0YRB9_COCSC|nr:DUF1118-domain-containing protein [Coccomyxa subellipsoidea C-169]EIE20938.1 DUF1118-domain-containing protein [Coccomyxa subellipsoidea C-169]|eukprot:XP_005645482.1 DUF1118-domain-containing protein [Coccomyxa subellipsoidea C-169]
MKSTAATSTRSAVQVQAAVVTQRLKARPNTGTQKIGGLKKKTGTQPIKAPGVGTQVKKLTSIDMFGEKGKGFRPRQSAVPRAAPALLSRVEQLRLLSKAEQAGLLSLAEKNGLTLTFIERSGLLSKAEALGLLSAAADRNTPGALTTLALALFILGPALVYFVPDTSSGLIAAQVAGALLCVAGGSAAWGGASLIGALQKD